MLDLQGSIDSTTIFSSVVLKMINIYQITATVLNCPAIDLSKNCPLDQYYEKNVKINTVLFLVANQVTIWISYDIF